MTGDVKKADSASTDHGASHTHHTASTQRRLGPNNDPALDPAHEHHHTHLHHSERAMAGREDNMMYSKGTTDEPSTIPHQDPLDNALNRRHHPPDQKAGITVTDAEKGGLSPVQSEEDPQSHTFARFYSRYKIFFHLFIWLLFTGYDMHPSHSTDYFPAIFVAPCSLHPFSPIASAIPKLRSNGMATMQDWLTKCSQMVDCGSRLTSLRSRMANPFSPLPLYHHPIGHLLRPHLYCHKAYAHCVEPNRSPLCCTHTREAQASTFCRLCRGRLPCGLLRQPRESG